ncbi:hypothetical protein [Caulobacter segnis]|uniref:hypothetical protein n=1 Tax=Caulobacter segnis TaxID=88688 RepID=UPI001CBAC352|nr:hypothetical protein [Caulobacter segnis]UAL10042.1 hypothetical protein K8940_20100 [Caulobacter segnis]
MLDAILSSLLAGSPLAAALKVAAVAAGFLLGVRLLAAGGRTADDRDRMLVEAARRHGPATRTADRADPALPIG